MKKYFVLIPILMKKHEKILILGMARSGYWAAKILAKRNNTIVLNDANEKQDESTCNSERLDIHAEKSQNQVTYIEEAQHEEGGQNRSFGSIYLHAFCPQVKDDGQ